MKRFAPLLTLLAVAVLGGALFLLNVTNDPASTLTSNAAAASASAAAAPRGTTINLADPAAGATTINLADPAAPAGPGATTINLADLAPPAAGAPPAVAEKAYAGRSSGNEATVAIAVKDGRAIAYVCDGKKIEAWLEGTVSGENVALKNGDGTVTVTGTLTDKASLGDITVGSTSWPYSAKAVVAPAGLYEGRADVRGVANRIGWIVENDGRTTGNLRVAGEAEPRPAPALDPNNPGSVVLDGVAVVVTRPDGSAKVIR